MLFCGLDLMKRVVDHLWRLKTRLSAYARSEKGAFLPLLETVVVASFRNFGIESLNPDLMPITGLIRLRIGTFTGIFRKRSWVHNFILRG